jgi:hypothetical protein
MHASRRRFACWLTLAALAAGCSAAPSTETSSDLAPAATPASEKDRELEEWRKLMARGPRPGDGCFQVEHPSTTWVSVPCAKPPQTPYLPAPKRRGAPLSQTVGGSGGDVSPQMAGSGAITWAEGSFPLFAGAAGNAAGYSLQLNTNRIGNSPVGAEPACQTAADPSSCQGWQQFVYASELVGGPDMVYIQYWLLDYGKPTCPTGWQGAVVDGQDDCFTNSAGAASVPTQPLSNLQSLTLTATAGTSDTVTMAVGNVLYSVSQASVVSLSGQWSIAEFNVFGNGGGTQVAFNPGSTLVAQTITESSTGTRAQPGNTGETFTAESNNLTVVPGSVCPFGGDNPGIQFMESNAAGAVPPECPSLAPAPTSSVLVPQGADWSSNINILGALVGQSSNAALLPSTCWATVPSPVTWSASPSVPAEDAGPEIVYSVPPTVPVGTVYPSTVTCDNGQSTEESLTVGAPLFTANPATITVVAGSCALNEYADAELVWSNVVYDDCFTVTYTVAPPPVAGITAYTDGPFLMVCDATGVPQSFDLTVTTPTCNGVGTASASVPVQVVPCVKQTSCGNYCMASMPDGCGGSYDCANNCTGVYTCTAPVGETVGTVCCGPGQYLNPGSTTCECLNGGTWSSTLEECVPPPPPQCPAGKVFCAALNECTTVLACSKGGGGGGGGCKSETCE